MTDELLSLSDVCKLTNLSMGETARTRFDRGAGGIFGRRSVRMGRNSHRSGLRSALRGVGHTIQKGRQQEGVRGRQGEVGVNGARATGRGTRDTALTYI